MFMTASIFRNPLLFQKHMHVFCIQVRLHRNVQDIQCTCTLFVSVPKFYIHMCFNIGNIEEENSPCPTLRTVERSQHR